MTNPGIFPGNRDFDSRRISLLSSERHLDPSLPLPAGNIFLSDRSLFLGKATRSMKQAGMFMIRLCSDRAAYEAVPRKRLKVNLASLKALLERNRECEVAVWTPQFMVIRRRDASEVTIVDDGRMIIRNVADQDSARRIAETLLPDEVTKSS